MPLLRDVGMPCALGPAEGLGCATATMRPHVDLLGLVLLRNCPISPCMHAVQIRLEHRVEQKLL